MKYVIVVKPNTHHLMIAIKADDNKKIKSYKSEGYQIIGRLKSDNLISNRICSFYVEE